MHGNISKLIRTDSGKDVLVDLPLTAYFADGDHLELDDGTYLEVCAAEEDLYEITGSSPAHIAQLAWHIGNRHTPAEITAGAIYIEDDHVLAEMLRAMHLIVNAVNEPFEPESGAYSSGGHAHGHAHHDHGDHDDHGHDHHDHGNHAH